jgi:hypothetical protein
MDTRAINHILTHNYDYQKPEQTRYPLSEILGDGTSLVEIDLNRITDNYNGGIQAYFLLKRISINSK